jgi:hypothetical protein
MEKTKVLTVRVHRVSTWLKEWGAVRATVHGTPTRQFIIPVGRVAGFAMVTNG